MVFLKIGLNLKFPQIFSKKLFPSEPSLPKLQYLVMIKEFKVKMIRYLSALFPRHWRPLTFYLLTVDTVQRRSYFLYYGLHLAARFLLFGLLCKLNHFTFDLTMMLFNDNPKVFGNAYIFASIEVLCPLYFYYLLYISPNGRINSLLSYVLIERKKYFYDLNPDFKFFCHNRINKLSNFLQERKRIYSKIQHTSDSAIELPGWKISQIFPPVSNSLQMRVIFFNLIIEKIHYAIVAFLFCSFACGAVYYFFKLVGSLNLILVLVIVLDLASIFHFAISGMIYCLYTTYMANIFLIGGYFTGENQRLLALNEGHTSPTEARIALLQISLTSFSSNYMKVAKLVQYVFRSFGSKALFGFFLSNIFFNVYLFSILAFNGRQLSAVNRLIYVVFMSIQFGGPLLSIVPLSAISRSLHASGGRLFPLMGELSSVSSLLAKIRVLRVYEITCSDWKMACPIGPLGVVTSYSVFKVGECGRMFFYQLLTLHFTLLTDKFAFIYFGYIMYTVSFITKL